MEEHSAIGEEILAEVEGWSEIATIVRHHHERWDGQGYPDGLAREEIPLISRIIAAADAYNAMTSDRPYRDAMPSRVARLRLAQGVESQFDTAVVAAFEAISQADETIGLRPARTSRSCEQDEYLGQRSGQAHAGESLRRRLAPDVLVEYLNIGLRPGADTQLGVDVAEVHLRSCLCDEERASNLPVCRSLTPSARTPALAVESADARTEVVVADVESDRSAESLIVRPREDPAKLSMSALVRRHAVRYTLQAR